MVDPVRPPARALFAASLRPDDRVLVTGSAGWFGLTIAALLNGLDVPALFLTQHPREINHGNGSVQAVAWDAAEIARFAPTVVFDCAFILRDYIDSMTLERYVSENTVLTSRLLQLGNLAGIRALVSVSSGAAVHPVDAASVELASNPYGYLKRQAELAVRSLAADFGFHALVARPFSVSGGLVTRPARYALSDLILQSRTGEVTVSATHPVFRAYVGVDDFFAVALAMAGQSSSVLNSGGEVVEFSELAERVITALGSSARFSRPPVGNGPADDYYANDNSWDLACSALDYKPAGLDEQVRDVAANLWAREAD